MSPMDEYISGFPPNIQLLLEKIKKTIHSAAPEAEETISYKIPTFKLKGKNLVHFAAFKHHIGFYPMPSAITAFQKELTGYKQAKGSVRFPLDHPMPLKLIEKMVRYRVKEIGGKLKTLRV